MTVTATIFTGSLWCADAVEAASRLEDAARVLGIELDIQLAIDELIGEDEAYIDSDSDELLAVYDELNAAELVQLAEEIYNDDLLAISDRQR